MKNNTVGKVAIKTSRLPLARHNLSHDVSSTFSFGDLQPTLVRWCPPDSVNPISADYLIRPMPLAAPCFGHHFVIIRHNISHRHELRETLETKTAKARSS